METHQWTGGEIAGMICLLILFVVYLIVFVALVQKHLSEMTDEENKQFEEKQAEDDLSNHMFL